MKFQWYIVDLDNATVTGSNNVEDVEPYIEDPSFLVLTAQHGKYFADGEVENEQEVTEAVDYEDYYVLEDDEEDDEDEEDEDSEEESEKFDDAETEDNDEGGREEPSPIVDPVKQAKIDKEWPV